MQSESDTVLKQVDALVAELRKTRDEDRKEAISQELIELALGERGGHVRDHLDMVRREELLEVQWILEDVLEAVTPKAPEPPPEEAEPEEPEVEDPNRPLTAADLTLVYDDPRGLMLYKSKKGERWFATQVDPRSGQPQTFELHPEEIAGLRTQLAGSPYWLVGG